MIHAREGRSTGTGFTLVELLVTLSMLSLLTASGLAVFTAGTRASGKARRVSAMVGRGQAALQILSRDIRRAAAGSNVRLVALDAQYQGRSADTIDFAVPAGVAPRRGLGADEPTPYREVGFYIDNDPRTEARWLLRREDDTLDEDPLEGGQVTLVGPGVAELDLSFYDGLAWHPSWGGASEFPRAVRIEVTVVDVEGRENPMRFSTTVPVLGQ